MWPFRRLLLRRHVMVNLTSGRAIEGVLVKQLGPILLLKNAHVYEPGTDGPAVADGDVVIERTKVDFIQAL